MGVVTWLQVHVVPWVVHRGVVGLNKAGISPPGQEPLGVATESEDETQG